VAFLSNWQEFKEWCTFKVANRVKAVMVDMDLINWIKNMKNSTQLIERIIHLIPTE
jgi:glycerol-3-phosphate responsive antiterminator